MKQKQLTLLVVDDNLWISSSIKEYYEMRGVLVLDYHDGETLKQDLDDLNFDIAIVDRSLPGVDGNEIIKLIYEKYNKPRTTRPIIYYSATPIYRDDAIHPLVDEICFKGRGAEPVIDAVKRFSRDLNSKKSPE